MSNEEQVPDPLAEMDQMLRGGQDVAKIIRNFFIALRDTGFTDEQALRLTMNWHKAMTISPPGEDEG